MTITTTGRRIALVGLLALVASLIPFTGASADHLTGDPVKLDAETNVDAALQWSNPGAYPDAGLASDARDPERVLIGRDDLFADNLASGALQAVDDTGSGGPLLLTQSDTLNDDVADEIDRLSTGSGNTLEAVVLGGVNAISDTVTDALEGLDSIESVRRIEGETRIETAIEVTRDSGATTALLARAYDADGGDTSQAYVDALAAGAWAADAQVGLLLTETDVLTGNVADFLAEGQIEDIIIIGGDLAVSADVEAQVADILGDDNVSRVGGENRADTAVQIAVERGYPSADGAEGVILSEGGTDEGDIWADGLAAAATSALEDYPVVLSNGDLLPPETAAWAGADETSDEGGFDDFAQVTGDDQSTAIVCGPFTTQEACDQLVTIVRGDSSSDQGFLTTPAEGGVYTFTSDSTGEPVVQGYDTTTDAFTIDGEDATGEEFEAQAEAGDYIVVTFDTTTDGAEFVVDVAHDLRNTVDSDTGVVTEADTGTDTYTFTGLTGPVDVQYDAGDVFVVDGELTGVEGFEADIDVGDLVDLTTFGDGTQRHQLTNTFG